jgi:hypothetical protein
VGEFRYGNKLDPTAKIATIGAQQIIATAPYLKKINYQDSKSTRSKNVDRCLSLLDERMKRARVLLTVGEGQVTDHILGQIEKSKTKQAQAVVRKQSIVAKVAEHHNATMVIIG